MVKDCGLGLKVKFDRHLLSLPIWPATITIFVVDRFAP